MRKEPEIVLKFFFWKNYLKFIQKEPNLFKNGLTAAVHTKKVMPNVLESNTTNQTDHQNNKNQINFLTNTWRKLKNYHTKILKATLPQKNFFSSSYSNSRSNTQNTDNFRRKSINWRNFQFYSHNRYIRSKSHNSSTETSTQYQTLIELNNLITIFTVQIWNNRNQYFSIDCSSQSSNNRNGDYSKKT